MWVRMGGFIYRGCLTESGLPSAWFQLSVNGRACVHKMKDAECKQTKKRKVICITHSPMLCFGAAAGSPRFKL